MMVGITFGSFDLFHAGHIKMLEEAKSKCDYLIVGLQLDPSIDRPEKINLLKLQLKDMFKLDPVNTLMKLFHTLRNKI